jgi:hypothetical protein
MYRKNVSKPISAAKRIHDGPFEKTIAPSGQDAVAPADKIGQEYMGCFSLVVKNENGRSGFKFAFYLPEFRLRRSLDFAVIGSIPGNEFFNNTL